MNRLFALVFLSFGCAEYEMSRGLDSASPIEPSENSRSIRLDVTPSDASSQLLPQSFLILPEESWQDLNLELQPSTTISGNVHGYSIYPYTDVVLPGEDVPVEAQIQLSQVNSINGGLVNSDEQGNFSITIPKGSEYALSVTPLSPQNVPYTIVESLDFQQEFTDLEVDLGTGSPIYGQIAGFASHGQEATAQLIDTLTSVKGPQIDIAENGYFQLRAPTNRSDFTIRIQGTNNDLLPTLDIPIRLEDNDSDGFSLEVDMGEINPINISGQLLDPDGVPYSERAIIRFQSLELYTAEGEVVVETNNDFNGQFSTNLLEGRYKVDFIPPFIESEEVAPSTIEIEVSGAREDLEQVTLRQQIRVSGVILGPEGLPASDVTVRMRDVNFDRYTYSSVTDASGRIDMMVPPILMDVTLHPTNSIGAITNFQSDLSTITEEFEWSLQNGEQISGSVVHAGTTVPFSLIEVYQGDQLLANGLSDPFGDFQLQILIEE